MMISSQADLAKFFHADIIESIRQELAALAASATLDEATPFEAITEPQRSQKKRLKPSAIGFVLIALCLGIFTWHLFTARAIAFNFTPQADDIQVSGWLSFVLGERYLVRPGALTVSASAKGHIPFQRTLTISDAAEQNFEFEFERLPGQLEVLSQPAGADITIDGQVNSVTPGTRTETARSRPLLFVRASALRKTDFQHPSLDVNQ